MLGMLAVLTSFAALVAPAETGYQTGHASWRDFTGWTADGVTTSGGLRLAPGRTSGTAVSPVVRTGFGAREAIPSWNAATPAGTWLEARVRARVGGRWTRWYELGSWSSRSGARRHSVDGQRDARGRVATDTLRLAAGADALQLSLRLHGAVRVSLAAVAFSSAPSSPRSLRAPLGSRRTLVDVPKYSQMVYPDGGEAWCSPTSVAMVVAYWQRYRGPAEPRVRQAARGTYDRVYRGNGNWAFNVAYAATQGLEAQVARFASLREVERWVAAGVPVVASFAWRPGQLEGAGGSSDGHLAVVVGFERDGDPIVNDPAARTNAAVRRTYPRAQLERLWLRHSGGTVYLIHPRGLSVPQL
jgi:hypothetical protein